MSLRWFIIVLLIGLLLGGTLVYLRASRQPTAAAAAQAPVSALSGVSCLGRIEPEGGVVTVAAPQSEGHPTVIERLAIREGDWVEAGQLLAVLDSRRTAETGLAQAVARAAVARSKLSQAQAGPRDADVKAAESDIAAHAVDVEHAAAEFGRFEQLRRNRDISASELDTARANLDRAKAALNHSRARLAALREIRPADVDVARAELNLALAEEVQRRTQLKESEVYAPTSGRVLKINSRTGEMPGPNGILDLADTRRMIIVAEVYETDASRVRVGQVASISGAALPGKLNGVVVLVGRRVRRNSVLPNDPAEFAESRVVEARIRLNGARLAESLIDARVSVVIGP